MKFDFTSQFQQTVKPGDRYWVSGFRLAANARKIVRNQPPILIEACCDRDPQNDMADRAQNRRALYIVPVKSDGLDYSKASTASDLNFVDTQEEAMDLYRHELNKAKQNAAKRLAEITKVNDRIDGIVASLSS